MIFFRNTTAVEASEDKEDSLVKIFNVGIVSIIIALNGIILAGNFLIVLAVWMTRELQTVTNCFIQSLAVADFLVGLCVLPPAIMLQFSEGVWLLSDFSCDLWIYLDVLLCTASILSLCAISIDRFLAISRPISYSRLRRSKGLAFKIIVFVWLLSFLITCPPMFGWFAPENDNQADVVIHECRYNENPAYVFYSSCGSFYIPMVVILYTYARIFCLVRARNKEFQETHQNEERQAVQSFLQSSESVKSKSSLRSCKTLEATEQFELQHLPNSTPKTPQAKRNGNIGNLNTAETASERSWVIVVDNSDENPVELNETEIRTVEVVETNQIQRSCEDRSGMKNIHIKETRTAKRLAVVVSLFIICWLPFFIFYILAPFIDKNDFPSKTYAFFTWLGWINSALNPFIYSYQSKSFRNAFYRLTVGCVMAIFRRKTVPNTNNSAML